MSFQIVCLLRILIPFAEVTERLSGESYPTFALAFPLLRMIKSYLNDEDIFNDDFARVCGDVWAEVVLNEDANCSNGDFRFICEKI
ncbi:hypothetical protein THRCLA_23098 [Thraustotheca clavata]|uniref:Uncharacterized protein n=1 Tax=Thraustotheca clavata TaxID=74557 RepID=A0A1V9YEG2_9STRA|nr:hypothetical protein THRCLA_23098 [Thraustotheca clavata]